MSDFRATREGSDQASFRAGFAALVGRPNVGKSTLLNALVGEKLSIVTPRPQTTRHRVLGVLNRPGVQIAFVDTPGLHLGERRALNRAMNRTAAAALADADLVVFVVEALRFDRNRNYGYGLAWSITKALHLAGSIALTKSFDEPRTNENESTNLDLNLSYRLHWHTSQGRGIGGQLFVRYSDLDFASYDRLFGFNNSNRTRIVIGGINFSMQ